MKKITYSLFLIICFSTFSQESKDLKDNHKNQGYFNITKYTHYRINNAKLDFTASDNSVTRTDVKGSNANGNSIQTINGFFLSPKFSLGIGLGLERFDNPGANTFPIFIDARYYLEDNYNSIYTFANAGTLAKVGDDFNKGAMLGIGLGYKFFINSNKTIALLTDLGYNHRLIKVPFIDNPNTSDLILSGFSISIGTIF
jgi:hypothetical protein